MVSTQSGRLLLFLLLSARLVASASLSLSQFQQIIGFSNRCLTVWDEKIPGCTSDDFSDGQGCSSDCVAGMGVIQAAVLTACAGARVDSNTLLGVFLDGRGVAILCPNNNQGDMTPTTAPSTSPMKPPRTSTTSTATTQPHSQTVQETTTMTGTQQEASTTTSATTMTSPSDTSVSMGATTQPSSTTSTSAATTTTTTADPAAKGFGGVGNRFNIIGNDGRSRMASLSLEGISVTMGLAVLIAATIW